MARKRIDPETLARWDAARRLLEERVEEIDRWLESRRAAVEKRRSRLRRWSFGLLGRGS